MTDVRQQLTEALDEAEKQAKAALHHPLGDDDSVFGQRVGTDSGVWVVDEHDDRQVVSPTDSIFIYNEGGHNEDQAAHIARWDPATVLRLVERDRALLDDMDEAQSAMDAAVSAFEVGRHGELVAATARCKALRRQVERAAASWLGTPEAES